MPSQILSGAASGAATGTAILPGWGTAIGAVVGGIAGALGKQKAPKNAAAPYVDLAGTQRESINANAQNFGAASALATKTNDFNSSEQIRLLEKAMPGFGRLQATLLAKVNQDLNTTGLPAEIEQQISRYAAEKGISRGTSGGFNGLSLARDFGFSLIDYDNAKRARALNTLSTVFGMAPRVNPTSPMAMFVDPNTALNVRARNEDERYNAEQGAYNASTDASNYNRSLMAGAAQIVLQGAGAAYDARQNKPASEKVASPQSYTNAITAAAPGLNRFLPAQRPLFGQG